MKKIPASVARFLEGKRIAVAGVSRSGQLPSNAIFHRLRDTGHEVFPVNPATEEVEGQRCYADVASVPGTLDGVVIATHPAAAAEVARQALARGVRQIWFHRSIGSGSVSDEAVDLCRKEGVEPIVGGCPMMYCGNVDIAHRCFRWWFGLLGRVPA